MLDEILKTLKAHQGVEIVPNKVPNKLKISYPDVPDKAWEVYGAIRDDNKSTSASLAQKLDMSDRMVRKYISILKSKSLLTRKGSNKAGWWEVGK